MATLEEKLQIEEVKQLCEALKLPTQGTAKDEFMSLLKDIKELEEYNVEVYSMTGKKSSIEKHEKKLEDVKRLCALLEDVE